MITVGTKVRANWHNTGDYYVAWVTAINDDGTYDLRYERDTENNVPPSRIIGAVRACTLTHACPHSSTSTHTQDRRCYIVRSLIVRPLTTSSSSSPPYLPPPYLRPSRINLRIELILCYTIFSVVYFALPEV